MKLLLLALALLFVAPAAPALQGEATGTLPIATRPVHNSSRGGGGATAFQRQVGWLSAHQTLDAFYGDIRFHISSTHDAEEDLQGGPPPSEPQTIETPWSCQGFTFIIKTPRWASETGQAGEERWLERHRHALETAQRKFPRD